MLSKLLKYEIKATARIFLPLMAVLLVFAGVNKLISSLSQNQWQAPEIISLILYITILVGILVMTLVVMIQRFYKNLLTDEGYLMFTLPVKVWKQITSKLVVAMMWTIVSGIAALVSIFIIAYDKIFTEQFMGAFKGSYIFEYFNLTTAIFILEFLLLCLVSMASNVLIIYASIALGHLFNRHRILASIGAFIVLSTASQILFTVVGYAFGSMYSSVNISSIQDFQAFASLVHSSMWFFIIFFGLLSAGYFALTNYILSRRLNLE